MAACFVRDASHGQSTLERGDGQTQLVLLERRLPTSLLRNAHLHLYARYSYPGENICAPSTPYIPISLEIDPTQASPVSTSFSTVGHGRLELPENKFLAVAEAVKSWRIFRGTLIDGYLQPNVRLGNGLEVSVKRPARKKAPLPKETQEQQNIIVSDNTVRQQQTSQQDHENGVLSRAIKTNRRRVGKQVLSLDSAQTSRTSPNNVTLQSLRQRQKKREPGHRATSATKLRTAQLHEQEGELAGRASASFWKEQVMRLERRMAKTPSHFRQQMLKHEQHLAANIESKPQPAHHMENADGKPHLEQKAVDVSETNTSLSPTGRRGSGSRPGSRSDRSSESYNGSADTRATKIDEMDKETRAQAAAWPYHDDIMPTTALEMLRQAGRKRGA
ncbi:hypothetical protein OPT61_g9560 [Boeremia exigua]|uniref:Uncharacterized protein n=1 Tax=Boeremia exigua TaxID=749465 RepID=A0ACC2HTR5_9PLEO|nr:hypothetical protein OPT61_g9560 [Boeremia exigua]